VYLSLVANLQAVTERVWEAIKKRADPDARMCPSLKASLGGNPLAVPEQGLKAISKRVVPLSPVYHFRKVTRTEQSLKAIRNGVDLFVRAYLSRVANLATNRQDVMETDLGVTKKPAGLGDPAYHSPVASPGMNQVRTLETSVVDITLLNGSSGTFLQV
jgi:hypothetical protein